MEVVRIGELRADALGEARAHGRLAAPGDAHDHDSHADKSRRACRRTPVPTEFGAPCVEGGVVEGRTVDW
ncbi:hypothetical protein Dac01nite_20990 [Demequina activiva]|uniref:Uncharacterized protein n=1 Tax=Demequina activiva TaxID=1582364 RepID=A0A919UGY3_9MICO|nr:hypothetical protein Dac01nite_20990 [Demequina activiva]